MFRSFNGLQDQYFAFPYSVFYCTMWRFHDCFELWITLANVVIATATIKTLPEHMSTLHLNTYYKKSNGRENVKYVTNQFPEVCVLEFSSGWLFFILNHTCMQSIKHGTLSERKSVSSYLTSWSSSLAFPNTWSGDEVWSCILPFQHFMHEWMMVKHCMLYAFRGNFFLIFRFH